MKKLNVLLIVLIFVVSGCASMTSENTTLTSAVTENTTATEATAGIEISQASEFFIKFYVPYVSHEKSILFDDMKKEIISSDYHFALKEEGLKIIKVYDDTDEQGDYVSFLFFDESTNDNIVYANIIEYYHASSNNTVSLENNSADGDVKHDSYGTQVKGSPEVEVSGVDEQIIFLFSDDNTDN